MRRRIGGERGPQDIRSKSASLSNNGMTTKCNSSKDAIIIGTFGSYMPP
jgi:hypothetical protein